MLSAFAHSLTSGLYAQLPRPFAETNVSHFTPPTDLTPGIVNRRTHTLLVDGDTKISRVVDWDPSDPEKPEILTSYLHLQTGNAADRIHVRSWSVDKLQIFINDKPHLVDINTNERSEHELFIESHGGDDTVIIDDDVKLRVSVQGGDGNDYLQAGGGRSRLFGGAGSDILQLGSGLGYAEGNDGDDTIMGGPGNGVMYGNKGKDLLIAGFGPSTRQTYLDGGDDNDVLLSGSGHTVAHGGNGDDVLAGYERTTFYTGKGNDTIWNNQRKDLIYAKATDGFDRTRGSTFTEVKPSNAGNLGFSVETPPQTPEEDAQAFKQRVADDFEFLRSSPIGQQALKQMDELAVTNGGKVTIEPIGNGGTDYIPGGSELDELTPEERESAEAGTYGHITDGVPGFRVTRGIIRYDPPSIIENAERTNTMVPVTGLAHEINHAYTYATGTTEPGYTREAPGDDGLVENGERQAVGLPYVEEPSEDGTPPSTSARVTNPKHFTENALNAEMGKPLRESYLWTPSPQGRGN
ncbi:Effector protein [Pseudomonas marginalis]|uniref:M91 family zinc metallopeptidase n=1 Tax=Pseudomonas marginalis TaxID=298 RepID=UPI0039E0EC51